jgi:hypothetical protein
VEIIMISDKIDDEIDDEIDDRWSMIRLMIIFIACGNYHDQW